MTQDTDDTEMLATLLGFEEQVWEALWNGDAKADAALLLPDFLGVYPSGFATRADHAGQLDKGASIEAFRLSEARVLPVGADHAMLSYRADFTRAGNAKAEAMYVSSLWQRDNQGDGQGWRNLFSQDTPTAD